MHYHSFLFSVMCKCSYNTEEDPNRPVAISTVSSQGEPSNAAPSSAGSQGKVTTTALNTSKCDDSSKGHESAPSPSKALQVKRGKLKRRVTIASTQSASSSSIDKCADETDWPPFADEDYIVFCFEEDGAFHVVMEENSPRPVNRKLQDEDDEEIPSGCARNDEIKDVNQLQITTRRDCFLPNKEIEERVQLSPEFDSDRTEEHDQVEEDTKYQNSLMECQNGSAESSSSSQSDCEQEHRYRTDEEIECPWCHGRILGKDSKIISPAYRRDCLLANIMAEEEESVYLSPRSENGGTEADQLKDGEDLGTGSESDGLRGNQLEEFEDAALESDKSRNSSWTGSSSGSFSFPVLQWECSGSPVAWPKARSLPLRKHRSRHVCLRCCRF